MSAVAGGSDEKQQLESIKAPLTGVSYGNTAKPWESKLSNRVAHGGATLRGLQGKAGATPAPPRGVTTPRGTTVVASNYGIQMLLKKMKMGLMQRGMDGFTDLHKIFKLW